MVRGRYFVSVDDFDMPIRYYSPYPPTESDADDTMAAAVKGPRHSLTQVLVALRRMDIKAARFFL
jgi:hypothetical protein